MTNRYPSWICHDCGVRYGRVIQNHCATYHEPEQGEQCGWCNRADVALTEPRDYGHPAPKGDSK